MVGLANPGAEYEGTRHNVGGEVVQLLAARHGAKLRKGKERAMVDEITVDGRRLALAIPLTYMNLSGEAVAPLVRRHGIEDPHHLVIVHDELDLPVGTLKVKVGGGLAGNNGLKSVKAHLHTDDFVRVRIGIGKPPGRSAGRRPRAQEAEQGGPRRARRHRPGGRRRRGAHPHRRPGGGDEPLQHAPRPGAIGSFGRISGRPSGRSP